MKQDKPTKLIYRRRQKTGWTNPPPIVLNPIKVLSRRIIPLQDVQFRLTDVWALYIVFLEYLDDLYDRGRGEAQELFASFDAASRTLDPRAYLTPMTDLLAHMATKYGRALLEDPDVVASYKQKRRKKREYFPNAGHLTLRVQKGVVVGLEFPDDPIGYQPK